MAKIELKGFIIEVGKEETATGENGQLRKQKVILKVPAYRDQFDEVKGKDEFWRLEVLGSNIDTLKLTSDLEGKKALATVFINSSLVIKPATPDLPAKEMFIVNCVLWKLELK